MRRLVFVLAMWSAAAANAAAGDVTAGREAAGQHCTRCHIVGDLNTMNIGSTPSFQYMVNHLDDFEQRCREASAMTMLPGAGAVRTGVCS